MLLSVSGTSMVGDDGSGAATAWRDDGNCFPGFSVCTHADVYATSTSTSIRSAIKQRQQLR